MFLLDIWPNVKGGHVFFCKVIFHNIDSINDTLKMWRLNLITFTLHNVVSHNKRMNKKKFNKNSLMKEYKKKSLKKFRYIHINIYIRGLCART